MKKTEPNNEKIAKKGGAKEYDIADKPIIEQIEDTFFEKLNKSEVFNEKLIESLKALNKEGALINKDKIVEVLKSDTNTKENEDS